MKKLAVGIASVAFVLGTLACGGAPKTDAKDSSDEPAADDGGEKKSLEKFEGNRMEKGSDEEE